MAHIAKSGQKYFTEFMENYLNGIEKAQVKIDSVPYEQFPYCCSKNNVLKNELDLAKIKGIAPIKK